MKNTNRLIKFISIFKPGNLYKIFVHLHSVTNQIPGRTTELMRIINENNYASFLEVGLWEGDNLITIAKNFLKLKCFGTDLYDGGAFDKYYKGEIMAQVDNAYYENLYQEVMKKTSKLNNIELIRKTSVQASLGFDDKSLDVVFIDARHDYQSCKNDILTWLPKVKCRGIIWT